MAPLFPADLLHDKLTEFSLRKISDLAGKQAILADWIAQLRAGKLTKQKEEAVKSRFVADIFGKVLGFNSKRAGEWQLEEELRTPADATKPDAALGYFTADPATNLCRAVIELKGAAANLDKKQPRHQSQSAVSQAFEYAHKMGPECRWVVVANLQEIRFYYHDNYNCCQLYRLDELEQEDRFKELLFLFHKDRFLARRGPSKTEKLLKSATAAPLARPVVARHLVAELEECRLQFAGLHFVDPHYLAALHPFNILPQHVWHYERGTLLSLNPRFCHLLENISVEQGQLRMSEALAQELQVAGIGEGERRLTEIFQFLNHCHITRFKAVRDYQAIERRRSTNAFGSSNRHFFSFSEAEGVDKEINVLRDGECPCPQCRYRRLDLNDFLGWLKSDAARTEEERLTQAYGHYLAATNGFKAAYEQYEQLEQQAEARQEKDISYFLARYNRLRLHNLLRGNYRHADSEQLLADLREIDLVTVVTDELEATITRPARDYLLEILDDKLLRRAEHQVQDTTEKLHQRRRSLRRGGTFSGPNFLADVWEEYAMLYRHLNRNFLVADAFRDYRTLARRVLRASLLDYNTPKQGWPRMAEFFLEEAVFNLEPADLKELLAKTRRLKTGKAARQALLKKLSNLLRSSYKRGLFHDPQPNPLAQEFLLTHHFKDKLTNAFSNLLLVLARLRIRQEEVTGIAEHLLAFLKVDEMLGHQDIEHLAAFIQRQGHLLGEAHLGQLLELVLLAQRGHRLRYYELIEPLADVLFKHFPTYQVADLALLSKAFAVCELADDRRNGLWQLVVLTKLANEAATAYLRRKFEERLTLVFDAELYERLLRFSVLPITDNSDYFRQLVTHINQVKREGFTGFRDGRPDYQDFYFYNFALLVYDRELDFRRPELALFTNLSDFERWLLNPLDFDYAHFDADWLRALYHAHFFPRLHGVRPLVRALHTRLARTCSPELYRLYFRHFAPATQAVQTALVAAPSSVGLLHQA